MVIIGTMQEWKACRITDIIVDPSENGVAADPYLVIEPFVKLSSKEAKKDCYRKYPFAGRLFHENIGTREVARASAILCHFAAAPVFVNGMDGSFLHVLPLQRVSTFFFFDVICSLIYSSSEVIMSPVIRCIQPQSNLGEEPSEPSLYSSLSVLD